MGLIVEKKICFQWHIATRNTARSVVSTPSVVLTGYPPCPDLAWGGYPTWVPPHPDLAGYPPRCLPHGILGNVAKHYGIWVPPPCLPHGILGNVSKHYGIWVPPSVCTMEFWEMLQSTMEYGYPPPRCGQTDWWMEGQTSVKTLPSRRTTYAGGNNDKILCFCKKVNKTNVLRRRTHVNLSSRYRWHYPTGKIEAVTGEELPIDLTEIDSFLICPFTVLISQNWRYFCHGVRMFSYLQYKAINAK